MSHQQQTNEQAMLAPVGNRPSVVLTPLMPCRDLRPRFGHSVILVASERTVAIPMRMRDAYVCSGNESCPSVSKRKTEQKRLQTNVLAESPATERLLGYRAQDRSPAEMMLSALSRATCPKAWEHADDAGNVALTALFLDNGATVDLASGRLT